MTLLTPATSLGLGTIGTAKPQQGLEKTMDNISKTREQIRNLSSTNVKDQFTLAAGTAASVGAAAAVAKSAKAQGVINKIINSVASKAKPYITKALDSDAMKKAAPAITKIQTAFVNLPKPAKAVLLAGATLTGLASNAVRNNGMKNFGAIEQKYEDKAKIREALI